MKVMRQTFLALLAAATMSRSAAFLAPKSSPAATTSRYLLGSTSSTGSTLLRHASSSSSNIPIAEKVLQNPQWPSDWPYSDDDFARMDEQDDGIFYDQPRLVYHIDDAAVSALTDYYSETLKDGDDVLDICSSWVSHYPKDWKGGNVVGLGMNDYELSQNKQLSSYIVKDLNKEPVFPFDDESFDKVTCVVSVDYLNKPKEIFNEIARVLKPGGECILSMSNRW